MVSPDKDDPDALPWLSRKLLWLDDMGNVRRLAIALAAFCALLFAADLVFDRHGHFGLEDLYGFYGFFGFLAFSFIVIAAKNLRRVIGRPDDYYAPGVIDREDYPDEELGVSDHDDR